MDISRSSPVPSGSTNGLEPTPAGTETLSHLLRNVIKPLYDEPDNHSYHEALDAFRRILQIENIIKENKE